MSSINFNLDQEDDNLFDFYIFIFKKNINIKIIYNGTINKTANLENTLARYRRISKIYILTRCF